MPKVYRLNPSWPLWAIGGSAAILGATISAVIVFSHCIGITNELAQQRANMTSRIAILEVALNQAQPYQIRLENESGSTPTKSESIASQQETKTAGNPPLHAPKIVLVPPPAPKQPPVATKPSTATPPANQPSVAPAAVAVAQVAPQSPTVSPEELAQAHGSKIEGVTAAKAGIKKLYPDAVEFASGRYVRKGENFPSGEKLLSVDTNTGRIITSQRQLIIFESQ